MATPTEIDGSRSRAVDFLDASTHANMLGAARRLGRQGVLRERYIDVYRYVQYVESLKDEAHEHQAARYKLALEFLPKAAFVLQERREKDAAEE